MHFHLEDEKQKSAKFKMGAAPSYMYHVRGEEGGEGFYASSCVCFLLSVSNCVPNPEVKY